MITDSGVYWRIHNHLRHDDKRKGEFAEKLWGNIILACGLCYIPYSELPCANGKGPRMQGNDAILPDFNVSGQRHAYLDSKCKTGPVLYRNAKQWRHGIDRKCWENYSVVSGVNKQKCIIGVVELFTDSDEQTAFTWSGALLAQTLYRLGEPIPGYSNQKHMVYWPRVRFVEVGTLYPAQMWNIANGDEEPVESVIKRLRDAFFGVKPSETQSMMF